MYHAIMHMPSGSLLPASSSLHTDISEHSSLHRLNLKEQLIVSLVVTLLTLKAVFTDAGCMWASMWADLLLCDLYQNLYGAILKRVHIKVNNMFHVWLSKH